VCALTLPACVIKLTDRNSPAVNGAVTGAPADCSQTQALPGGAPGGAAEIKYVGRYVFTQPEKGGEATEALFDYSGNNISFRFQGASQVTVKLALDGAVPQDQLFEFVVDNNPPSTRLITVQQTPSGQPTNLPLTDYLIDGLDPGAQHEVTINKNTEAQQGAVVFQGVDLHGGHLVAPTRRPRRIEFIGDSIMCGYGDEGNNATCPFEITVRQAHDASGNVVLGDDGKPIDVSVPVTENQYLSFTSLTARALDADAVTVCWSGKGVALNYKEKPGDPDAKSTIPDLWSGRAIAGDMNGNKWDFKTEKPEEVPQVVVISLGTNDYARDTLPPTTDPDGTPGDNVPDGDMDIPATYEQFVTKYTDFVKNVRSHRPNAHIFLAVPPMVSDQFPLNNARTDLKNALLRIVNTMTSAGDTKVYEMELVEMGYRYGLGCDYHPNLEVHQIMSQQLVGAIRSKTCW
jgi:lysophospholipase L1-like esterase